jgi:hypothetical protein
VRYLKNYTLYESSDYNVLNGLISKHNGDWTKIMDEHQTLRKRQERLRFLEDMSLELCDENFNVQVTSEVLTRSDKINLVKENYVVVNIQKKSGPSSEIIHSRTLFDYNKIKDTLLSMVSYMREEGYSIRGIEVNAEYAYRLIPVELEGEELHLKFKPEEMIDYPIGQLVIKFKE